MMLLPVLWEKPHKVRFKSLDAIIATLENPQSIKDPGFVSNNPGNSSYELLVFNQLNPKYECGAPELIS